MASYDGRTDISSTNPYPFGVAQVLCHGSDITLHVPSTGVHLNSEQATELAHSLLDAVRIAKNNKASIGL